MGDATLQWLEEAEEQVRNLTARVERDEERLQAIASRLGSCVPLIIPLDTSTFIVPPISSIQKREHNRAIEELRELLLALDVPPA